MNLPSVSQSAGNGRNLPVSKTKPQETKRRKHIRGSQAAESVDELPSIAEESLELSFIVKERSFKEELAGSVFQKQLSDHLSRKVSQLFDGIRLEVERAERRSALTAPIYDTKSLSFGQKISGIAFSYLSRINHAITTIANHGDVSYALNEADRVFEAIDEGFSSTLAEIQELGILNPDMETSFNQAKSTMESGLLINATKVLSVGAEQTVSSSDAAATNKLIRSYQLRDSVFTSLLLSRYNTDYREEPTLSRDKKIRACIETGEIAVINMQAVTGESIAIYLANENNHPLAEKWFREADVIAEHVSVQRNRYVKLLAGFGTHLEESEFDAVRQLLNRFVRLGDSYFTHHIGLAYLSAENYGYSSDELAAYLMDSHRKLYRKNIDIYHDVASGLAQTSGAGDAGELGQLEAFVQQLYGVMSVAQEFGIKNSDEFVSSVLSTVISYDGRQNYDFYRPDFDSRGAVSNLIKGIRDVGL